jgi:homoserine dehydrogenase
MTHSARRGGLAVDLHGYGHVARAFLKLLPRNGIRLATVSDSTGIRVRCPVGDAQRVFVDATSPQYDGGAAEAWVLRLEEALEKGTPVVTCNKAPLAIAWARLERAARRGQTTVFCAGTVGGGTPVLLFLQRLHQSHGVERIDAALNVTLEYVCSQVAAGSTIEDAVQQAQSAGWAERDPSLDLDGTDVYAKAIIIHNLLFSTRRPLVLDGGWARLRLEEETIRRLRRSGKTSQVQSVVTPGHVALDVVGVPFGGTAPDSSGLVYVRATLRDGSKASISGPGAGSWITAGSLVGDLRTLADVAGTRPWGVAP